MRALLLSLVAVTVIACRQQDSLYCCTSQASCNEAGGDGKLTPCTDPNLSYCDDVGAHGLAHTCIADPNQTACNGPSDCSNPAYPYCVQQHCRACDGAMGCTAAAPVCSSTFTCGACSSEADCSAYASAGKPHCDQGGACVECRSGASDCSGNTPICDQGSCRACETGTECASGVCDTSTGACVAEADVIYMAPNGSGTLCSQPNPCGTFANALPLVAGTRTTIHMTAGSYSEAVTISGKTVTIIGDGADLSRSTAGAVIDISGDATAVRIVGLQIHNGLGAGGDGIRCALTASTSPSVTVSRAKIDTNGGKGINASSCALDISRSTILGNVSGGVSITSGSYQVRNNYIVKNGSGTGTIGGVFISQVTSGGTHVFDFNTVAQNTATVGVTPGIICSVVTTPLTFTDGIVYGNGAGMQVEGNNCSYSYTDVGPQAASGTGNINADPIFVNAGQGDFHLMAASPAKDVADPAATLNIDFDGDSRPQGARSEMGADEVLP